MKNARISTAKRRALFILLLAFMVFLPLCVCAAPTVLKMSFYQPPTHFFIKVAQDNFSQVEKLTNGRIVFQVFHTSTLCKATQMYDYVNRGMAFAAFPCNAYFTKTFRIFGVDTLGVYTNGVQGMYAAYRGGLDDLIRQYLHEKGMNDMVYLGTTCFSGRSPGAQTRINFPSDFKGLKIRALGNEKFFVEQGGGASVSFPAPQVYEGLQRGMIDGIFGQESNWVERRFCEQVKYIKFVDLTAAPMAVIYNKNIMAKLSNEDQKIVKGALEQYLERMYEEMIKVDKKHRDFLLKEWKGNASYPTAAEKKEWVTLARKNQERFEQKHGEYVKKALETIKKYND